MPFSSLSALPDTLLHPDRIRTGLGCGNRRGLFAEIGRLAAATLPNLDAATVVRALESREREGSTGFGGGVALPHARIAGMAAPAALVLRLEPAIDMKALDGAPVDLVLALLSPLDAPGEHLRALACLGRVARSSATLEMMRGARSRDALAALLTAPRDDLVDAA
jgi:PTS system nitrogen regulatory IIA component